MNILRRTVLALALAGAALLGGLAAPGTALAADVKPRLIRFGYGLAEETNQGRAARVFVDEIKKLSDGKLKVKAFGSASLGSDVQMQNALMGGAQELMVGSTATLVGVVPQMALWDTPFLFANEKEADAVLDGPVGQKLLDKLQGKGLVGIVYWENGFRNLTNNKRSVTRMEDLGGIKLRVMQNNVFLETFRTLGANAIPLSFSELFTALETQAVDGQENPFNTILTSKFYEVQKYLTVTNHVYSPWVMLASKKWWDGLSRDEQGIIVQAARTARDFERQDTRAETARALKELEAKGMTVNTVSSAELQRMREKIEPVTEKLAQDVGQDLWKEAQQEIAKARAN
jgi:tripartite ATP-independent transporter DctP family solute receptor